MKESLPAQFAHDMAVIFGVHAPLSSSGSPVSMAVEYRTYMFKQKKKRTKWIKINGTTIHGGYSCMLELTRTSSAPPYQLALFFRGGQLPFVWGFASETCYSSSFGTTSEGFVWKYLLRCVSLFFGSSHEGFVQSVCFVSCWRMRRTWKWQQCFKNWKQLNQKNTRKRLRDVVLLQCQRQNIVYIPHITTLEITEVLKWPKKLWFTIYMVSCMSYFWNVQILWNTSGFALNKTKD